MNEKLTKFKERFNEFWNGRSKRQQLVILSSIVSIIVIVVLLSFLPLEQIMNRFTVI